VYQDRHVVVVNKPHGMVMYPGAGHSQGTLMNGVAFLTDSIATVGAPLRPGVVHRLDKDTSGIVVIALTNEAYYGLQRQFKARTVIRAYISLVYGRLGQSTGTIDAEIGRARTDRKRMSTRTRKGREAVTHYSVIESFRIATLVRVKLETGRTHQIRVHFASIGHPVLGDSSYGGKTSLIVKGTKLKISRQMLHAQTLGFSHPITDEPLEFTAPLPSDMALTLSLLRDPKVSSAEESSTNRAPVSPGASR
ncbi:MAG: RluA family pseudouridine synthase, partial [Thermodesulfovibrionales bacterium]